MGSKPRSLPPPKIKISFRFSTIMEFLDSEKGKKEREGSNETQDCELKEPSFLPALSQ